MEKQIIENINFNEIELDEEYYKCVFVSCDFSNRVIHSTSFDNCEFKQCNFTLVKFSDTLSDVKFIECKMTGVDFTAINKYSSSFFFEKSLLNYANFVAIKIRKTIFIDCNLQEAYFDNTDISLSVFDKCDLMGASFHETNLEKADFFTSYNFSINPSTNKIKKTIFSENELRGLLAHLDIVIK
ncbi:MAG TPA: pentapeptide repeat-containing protein [Dysgonomonas sp.]|uniref:pentapeptide repeat-containing protein n=1 Tax=unclassified Dysgonomonas TaxID=2630389 RepID=UPI0025BB5347|nr:MULTISPECIES: pentapeptide repeat-containing protein [unclassified Dysgonomonas]HML65160.1 pentapeptide repeat-containing protein [Dysgonomonas sp.]